MQHSIKLFRPTTNQHADCETLWTGGMAFGTFMWFVANGLMWGIVPYVGFITMFSILVPAFFVLYMTRTHEEWPLTRGQRAVWRQYKELDADIKSKVALDPQTLKKIASDSRQYDELRASIRNLSASHDRRKQEEARLDPTTSVILENIKQAMEDENEYRKEIQRALGDPYIGT